MQRGCVVVAEVGCRMCIRRDELSRGANRARLFPKQTDCSLFYNNMQTHSVFLNTLQTCSTNLFYFSRQILLYKRINRTRSVLLNTLQTCSSF